MNALAGPLAGMDRFAARDAVLQRLQAEGLLVASKPHTLSRGTHDRCGTVIEPYLSAQWFVRMQPLAEPAIRAVEEERVCSTRSVGATSTCIGCAIFKTGVSHGSCGGATASRSTPALAASR